MTESFIGQGGEKTLALQASKRALVNDKGRVDAISWARWDTLNARYVFSIRRSLNN